MDPASLMAFGFCSSVIVSPLLILLSVEPLWYILFVVCVAFGGLVLGWLLALMLAWCKGINVEVTNEGPVLK